MELQPLYNFAEILFRLGVRKAILSPGSRCAPLILALAKHPDITCYSISDERSAAFIALGMSIAAREPVVLVCTSGTAALNYGPVVAEAYFQQVPLILLTADRPPEWIGQLDGQTIWQENIYGKHVKKSISIQPDLSHPDAQWHLYRSATDGMEQAMEQPAGPVHFNFPFREPFYPEEEEDFYIDIPSTVRKIQQISQVNLDENELYEEWNSQPRRLILPGQFLVNKDLNKSLAQLSTTRNIPIAADIISNAHGMENFFGHMDLFSGPENSGTYMYLSPDLLITYGLSIVSKNIKTLLRNHKPKAHWHIQAKGDVADTFQSLTRIIRCDVNHFFEIVNAWPADSDFVAQKQENYFHLLDKEERRASRFMDTFFEDQPLGEFEMVKETLQAIPDGTVLHLANSMAVRYANWIGLSSINKNIEVMSNRGTCGIDGCSSTAVGAALAQPEKLHLLITGDIGFFYDRNAFWHSYNLPNLRILLLNNHGGGIFRMINGPGRLSELKEFFETEQKLTGKSLASEFGFEYSLCDKKSKVKNYLVDFFRKDEQTKILETESDSLINQTILKEFKQKYRDFK